MISFTIFSLFTIVKSYFITNMKTKYQIILYTSVFFGSVFEYIFFRKEFQHPLFTKEIFFIIQCFSMVFLSHILGKKENSITNQKIFILFILFSFVWIPMAFFSLFWTLYINDVKNEKIFAFLSIVLLGASSLVENNLVYTLLIGFVFTCSQQNSVEDYAIRNYILFLFLEKIGDVFISNIVISLVLLQIIFILVQTIRCESFLKFEENLFSCAILIGIALEIITEAGIFQTFLLSIILLKMFLNSVVKKYFLVFSKKTSALINIKEMLGNKNITLVFIFLMIFAPFNPVFNNIVFYLSQASLLDSRLYLTALFFLFLMLLAIYRTRILIGDIKIVKNNLPDIYQFFILFTPLILSIFFIPKKTMTNKNVSDVIGFGYFQYFFFLSLIYFLFMMFSIYFRKKTDQWMILSDIQLPIKMKNLDAFFKQTYTAIFSNIARNLHFIQVLFFQIINRFCRKILLEYDGEKRSKYKEEYGFNPSIEMGILFIILLLITAYYGHSI